jgi:hypothetical protein
MLSFLKHRLVGTALGAQAGEAKLREILSVPCSGTWSTRGSHAGSAWSSSSDSGGRWRSPSRERGHGGGGSKLREWLVAFDRP